MEVGVGVGVRVRVRVRERGISACSTRACSAREHMQSAAKSRGSRYLIVSAATSPGTPRSNPHEESNDELGPTVSDEELGPLSETSPRVRRLLLGGAARVRSTVLGARPTVSVDGGVSVELASS